MFSLSLGEIFKLWDLVVLSCSYLLRQIAFIGEVHLVDYLIEEAHVLYLFGERYDVWGCV